MNYQNSGQYVSMAQGFMQKVYAWMFAGLTASAAVSYYLLSNEELLRRIMSNFWGMMGLMVAMFGIILYMSSQFTKMSYPAVVGCYGLFTLIQGVFLAPALLKYTGASVLSVFVATALMFLVMAIYGTMTKTDLSSMGNILLMGVWGLIISGFVNIFLQSSILNTLASACGVGIFAMMIAYDVQMLKRLSQQAMMYPQEINKFAIMGALNLYLNMINLFLYLLRLFGEERKK